MTEVEEFARAILNENTKTMKKLVETGFKINETYPYPMGCEV